MEILFFFHRYESGVVVCFASSGSLLLKHFPHRGAVRRFKVPCIGGGTRLQQRARSSMPDSMLSLLIIYPRVVIQVPLASLMSSLFRQLQRSSPLIATALTLLHAQSRDKSTTSLSCFWECTKYELDQGTFFPFVVHFFYFSFMYYDYFYLASSLYLHHMYILSFMYYDYFYLASSLYLHHMYILHCFISYFLY